MCTRAPRAKLDVSRVPSWYRSSATTATTPTTNIRVCEFSDAPLLSPRSWPKREFGNAQKQRLLARNLAKFATIGQQSVRQPGFSNIVSVSRPRWRTRWLAKAFAKKFAVSHSRQQGSLPSEGSGFRSAGGYYRRPRPRYYPKRGNKKQ